MQVNAAIITEQGITFAIVLVKPHVVQSSVSARELREALSTIDKFAGLPIVLAAQDAWGTFTYQGRPDVARFLASLDASRIPWSSYTISGHLVM